MSVCSVCISLTYADVLAPDVELVALALALVVAPRVLALAVRARARQLLPALVQVWRRTTRIGGISISSAILAVRSAAKPPSMVRFRMRRKDGERERESVYLHICGRRHGTPAGTGTLSARSPAMITGQST